VIYISLADRCKHVNDFDAVYCEGQQLSDLISRDVTRQNTRPGVLLMLTVNGGNILDSS
jgi:hypothetical protein